MSSIKSKLERLEQATGINEPCEVCEAVSRSEARALEFVKQQGIIVPKITPARIQSNCGWCSRPLTIDLGHFNLSERVLYERMAEASNGGTLCLPKNKTLWDELTAAFDRVEREMYGAHYDEYRKVFGLYLDELAEISTRRAPAVPYCCHVPGCACQNPKSLAEARERLKGRREIVAQGWRNGH